MKKNLKTNKITLGTCYYPEHWPERLWKEDLKRMIDIGIEVIRIAEFAWSRFEPTEGNYTFEFFDRFLKAAEETGMKVIFCTPTATPPAWLTEKYPEVLNRTIDGVLFRHGGRRHYNYNSPIYRKFTEIIVEKIAQHYAPHPNIIGWQIDNEINCELNEFYSESDDMAFREFVREKYGTLETLNEAWGTAFWNQEYTDWSQVHVPQPVANRSMNPHRLLDYIRFVSASAREYVKLQSDILRKYIKKGDFITTNGMFGNLDNHKMTGESLDFYMYDSYPNFAYCDKKYVLMAQKIASMTGSCIDISSDPESAVSSADVVYTDTWISMGMEADKDKRVRDFAPYQVNSALFSKAKPDAVFLHCLPAYRGFEVTEDVIDGPRSLIFDEAENRLHIQKAVMATLMS